MVRAGCFQASAGCNFKVTTSFSNYNATKNTNCAVHADAIQSSFFNKILRKKTGATLLIIVIKTFF
jgi:hypothetical protein